MTFIAENWAEILEAFTACVGAFAIIATMTPNPKDDAAVNWLKKAVNFLGANFGKARNEG